ncbi:MAG: four helix bundle protein [bacterium]
MDVTELTIYKNALRYLKPIYKLADLLPNREYVLRNQLTKAAKSIAPMIHEGFAKKKSQPEFKRFLEMAMGSSDEVITHLREIKILTFPNVKEKTCD